MDEISVLKDLQEYKSNLQQWYNQALLSVINPEAKSLFTRLRDDETRAVIHIQQKLLRLESSNKIMHRIFPSRIGP